MAIDHIENNELGALAPSRIGYNSFVNDVYASGTKVGRDIILSREDGYANASGARKKLAAKIQGKWASLPTDCANIDSSIAIIEEDLAAQIKKSATEKGYNLKSTKLIIQQDQTALGELKKVKAANCGAVEQAAKAAEEQKFQDTLVKLSEQSVQAAKDDAASLTSKISSNKNVLLIGAGVLVLGVVAFLIFKKKK